MPEITFTLECLSEDQSSEGNASAIDDETDAEILTWINEQLESGNPWAWCVVKVTAQYGEFEGVDYLGGCSYESREDFERGGYYEDMKASALEDLKANLKAARTSMRGFARALRQASMQSAV